MLQKGHVGPHVTTAISRELLGLPTAPRPRVFMFGPKASDRILLPHAQECTRWYDPDIMAQSEATYDAFTRHALRHGGNIGINSTNIQRLARALRAPHAVARALGLALGVPILSPHRHIPTDTDALLGGLDLLATGVGVTIENKAVDRAREEALGTLRRWRDSGRRSRLVEKPPGPLVGDPPVVWYHDAHDLPKVVTEFLKGFARWMKEHDAALLLSEEKKLIMLSYVIPACLAIHVGIQCVDKAKIKMPRSVMERYLLQPKSPHQPVASMHLCLRAAVDIVNYGLHQQSLSSKETNFGAPPLSWRAIASLSVVRLCQSMTGVGVLSEVLSSSLVHIARNSMIQVLAEEKIVSMRTKPSAFCVAVQKFCEHRNPNFLEEHVEAAAHTLFQTLREAISERTLRVFDLERTRMICFNTEAEEFLARSWGNTPKIHPPFLRKPVLWHQEMTASPKDTSLYPHFLRSSQFHLIKKAEPRTPSGCMQDALNYLGRVPFQVNTFVMHALEECARRGYPVEKFSPTGFSVLNPPGSERETYKEKKRRQELDVAKKSEKLWFKTQLREAQKIARSGTFYVPHNMDFRGRFYPIPVTMAHTQSGNVRALYKFGEAKPLTNAGIRWLKIHAANVYGKNKLTFDERCAFIDNHHESILAVAEKPFGCYMDFWQEAESPFEFLGVAKELAGMWKSPNPELYATAQPVHVDGSANGLQHWAAIARDTQGAVALNMTKTDEVQDVYAHVLRGVKERAAADAGEGISIAMVALGSGRGLDRDHLKRSTVKRSVMTQVYGVTNYGMIEMIQGELEEQNQRHQLWSSTTVRDLAVYVKDSVNASLGTIFQNGLGSRQWLRDVAKLLMDLQEPEYCRPLCWTTPLGMVVTPPYFKTRTKDVIWDLNGATRIHDREGPASPRKQVMTLAPNFIHSLDAVHLAKTALAFRKHNRVMASVHDSYWCHPADMDLLSMTLREQFVDLYEDYDPLEALREQWTTEFRDVLTKRGVVLPPVPPRGYFDLRQIMEAPYFFS